MLVGPFIYWGIILNELGTPSIWCFFSTIGFDAAQYVVEVLLFYAPIG